MEVHGGSWVVISRGISRVTILKTQLRGIITLLITTPEPPKVGGGSQRVRHDPVFGWTSIVGRRLLLPR